MSRALLSALVLLSCLGAGTAARADSVPSVDLASAAREHFRQGVRRYREQSFDAALAEFTKANELLPDHRLLFNLAQVQMERHDYVAARSFYRRYLAEGGEAVAPARRAEVDAELAALSDLVAELALTVNVPAATMELDGASVGPVPRDGILAVNAGVHRVVVHKPGFSASEQVVTVAGNERQRLSFLMLPVPSLVERPVPPARAPMPPPVLRPRPALWLALAATAGLAASTAVFALRTARLKEEFEGQLAGFPGDPDGIEPARSRLRLSAAVTDGLAAGTVVAAGLSLYFAVTPASGLERVAPARRSQAPARLGISVSGRF